VVLLVFLAGLSAVASEEAPLGFGVRRSRRDTVPNVNCPILRIESFDVKGCRRAIFSRIRAPKKSALIMLGGRLLGSAMGCDERKSTSGGVKNDMMLHPPAAAPQIPAAERYDRRNSASRAV
jgi:hypothetical protein